MPKTHTITYQLSPTGRAAALRAGLPAQETQTIELPPDQVERLLASGVTPGPDGLVAVDASTVDQIAEGYHYRLATQAADSPLTAEGAVDLWARGRAAAVADARKRCEAYISGLSGRPDASTAKAAGLAAEVEAHAEQIRAEEEAKAVAERERYVAWLRETYDPEQHTGWIEEIREWGHDVRARAAALGLDDVVAKIDAHTAALAERAAAKKAAEDSSRATWLAWARDHGSEDLRAAIADGYPLGKAVEREVVAALTPEAPAGCHLVELGDGADDGDRRVPSAAVRAVRSGLVAAVSEISGRAPAGTAVEVGRVRAISWDEDGTDEYGETTETRIKATGVPVTISAAHHTATVWYVIDET